LETIDIRGKHAVHAGVHALCRKKNGEPSVKTDDTWPGAPRAAGFLPISP
jgi:hypothetical protein